MEKTKLHLILILILLIACASAITFFVFAGFSYLEGNNFGRNDCEPRYINTTEECKELAHTLYGEDPVLYIMYEKACESGCNCTYIKQDCGLLTDEKARLDFRC